MKKILFLSVFLIFLLSCSKEDFIVFQMTTEKNEGSNELSFEDGEEVIGIVHSQLDDPPRDGERPPRKELPPDEDEIDDSEEGGGGGNNEDYVNRRVGDVNSGYYLYYHENFLEVRVNYSRGVNNLYVLSAKVKRASSTGMPIKITTQYTNYSTLPNMNGFRVHLLGYWKHSSKDVGYPENYKEYFDINFMVNCLD